MTKSAGLGQLLLLHDWEDRLRKDLTENIVEGKMMQDISVVKEGVVKVK